MAAGADVIGSQLNLGVKWGIPMTSGRKAQFDATMRIGQMAVEVPHPLAGKIKIYANPIRLSETPIDTYTAPPTLGQHTAEVLKDLLGFDDGDLERLSSSKVI